MLEPEYNYEMVEAVIKLLLEKLTILLVTLHRQNESEVEEVKITTQYHRKYPNRSIGVDIQSSRIMAQVIVWSAGTADISAFEASSGDSLYEFHDYVSNYEDVAPHIEKIFALFQGLY